METSTYGSAASTLKPAPPKREQGALCLAIGFWNNSYLISELEADRMVWTVLEDAEDVSVYVRCEKVPEDIMNGTRAIK